MSNDPDVQMQNTMHDKCKNVVVFHNNLCKFFKSLKGVFPEYVENIRECIKYYKSVTRESYLDECESLLSPHIEYISQYDDGIFTDDYAKGPRYLLPKMDFREIWALLDGEDFRDEPELLASTKKAIFNHLQTLYVSIQMAQNQINVFNKNIEKQKQFLMDMMENLQMDDKIKERIEEMKKEEAEAAKNGDGTGGMFSMDKIAEMMGGDNFVFQLAQDIAEELDMGGEDIENPVEAITQLFANNGQKLQELIVTVGDRIEQKIQSGELDKDKLVKDAKVMKDKLEGFMGKIPGLEEMVNNNGIAKQFKDIYEDLQSDEQKHFSYIPAILDKNPMEWTESEQANFDEYAKYVTQTNDQSQKQKQKPKKKKKTRKNKH